MRSGSGRRVVLSQRQNYLWLVAASGRVVAQGPVVDNPRVLRAGSYRAGSKCGRAAKIRDNSDASGRLRLHDFIRFAPCGIGFHRIPQYRSTGAQIHSDRLLGTNLRGVARLHPGQPRDVRPHLGLRRRPARGSSSSADRRCHSGM